MSKEKHDHNEDQEIDLSQISTKIKGFFEGISAFIYRGFLFIKKNSITLSLLIILGIALGCVLDYTNKSYTHEVIVTPKFGSVDYLYSKINLLNSKIKTGDTLFLKSIGIQSPKKLNSIEIEPIIDIYSFVNFNTTVTNNAQNTQNFELVKLLSEDGDINKVIKDKLTSKNYPNHCISIVTDGFVSSKNTINPILEFLNKNDYYNKVRLTTIENLKTKMRKNEEMIKQIDDLLNEFSSSTTNQKSDKLVYYNENTQLNAIIASKNGFIGEIGGQKMDLINLDTFIKETSRVINVKNTKGINNKLKFILPLLFVFGFIFAKWVTKFYKKQAKKIA